MNTIAARDGWRAILMTSVSVVAISVGAPSAMAQDAPAQPAPAAGETQPAEEKPVEKVTVTGTRLKKDEFTSPSPVQIIDPNKAEKQGSIDTASTIQSSSISKGSAQLTSAISSAFVTNGGPGTATVSLRGLGDQRTLVLLNGRRAGPAGVRGAVGAFDLNVIPQSSIQSVEILKDGASSIYGSDAVAGVVNIITKRDTDGLEVEGFYSQPFESGGEEQRYTATYGMAFDDGYFQVSADYYKRSELTLGDRDHLNCAEDYMFDGAGNRVDRIDPRTGSYTCRNVLWGHLWLYDYSYIYGPADSNLTAPNGRPIRRLQYNYAGDNLQNHIPSLGAGFPAVDPFQLSGNAANLANWFPVGYSSASYGLENTQHPFVSKSTLIPETTRYTLFADGAYQLTSAVEVYAEALFNRRETEQNSFRQFWTFTWTNNTTLPGLFFGLPETGDVVPNGFTGDVYLSPTAITDWSGNSQKVDYYRAVGGARGDFGGALTGWDWDLFTQYSRSDAKYTSQQILDDAVDTQDFRTTSCVGSFLPISGRPCIDINWTDPEFLRGNFTPAQRAFLFDEEEGSTVYTQLTFEGAVRGTLFELPAGTVDAVVGATWRRDELNDTPGHITRAGNVWGASTSGITQGSSETTEYFGEVDVPLLSDLPLVKYFNVRMSGRYTDVSTVSGGGSETYKVGGNWQVNDWLRFRGTYGTSFRAPALFELFLADESGFLSQRALDPCIQWGQNLADGLISQQFADNCAADGVPATYAGGATSGEVFTGGGFGILKPETSTATSLSVVLTPDEFLPETTRVSIALDYYEIEVEGEVGQLGAAAIINGCYSSDFFPTDPLCSLFERGTAVTNLHNIITVQDSFININQQKNRGIDVTARVNQELPDGFGDLTILGQMSWQFEDRFGLFAGTVSDSNGEDGEPIWVGNFSVEWAKDEWSIFWGIDAVQHTSDIADFIAANGDTCLTSTTGIFVPPGQQICRDLVAESRVYHSLSATRAFDDWSITAGVANIFDTDPPRVSTNNLSEITTVGQSPFTSNYDFVGRRGFLSVSKKF